MKKIRNTQKISSIYMEYELSAFCPLGDDYYNANIEMHVDVGDYYPDYIDVTAELNKLNGQNLTIEDMAAKVLQILKSFEPQYASVKVKAKGHKHLYVEVEVEG